MPSTRPTEKKHRKAKDPTAISAKFVPRFWEIDADKRQTRLRLIRSRIDELAKYCGADTPQKKMLVERAIFLHLQCQTIELDSYDGRDVDLKRIAVHAQLTNTLSGVLSKLKLDAAKLADVLDVDLKTYAANKRAKERSK